MYLGIEDVFFGYKRVDDRQEYDIFYNSTANKHSKQDSHRFQISSAHRNL